MSCSGDCKSCASRPLEFPSVPQDAKPFKYEPMFQLGEEKTQYRLVTKEGVKTVSAAGREFLEVSPEAITRLVKESYRDINHLYRTAHLESLARIVDDPEASANDKYVALDLLKNAVIASGFVLPSCQDTGTAIVMGTRGQGVLTNSEDKEAISKGVYEAYTSLNLRYSQNAPLTMYKEVNTKTNLPAQIDLLAGEGAQYDFFCVAKGGGSANKTYLFQETKALLSPANLMKFVDAKLRAIGTAACPPYHLALVIGGTSAETCLKTVKLASCKYYDELPTSGSEGGRAFRDVEMEKKILELCYGLGIGAQFGGKYFAHDVRVVRLPRHGASCPVGLGVSCSADRQIKGKITKDGVFVEQLEEDPARFVPDAALQAKITSGSVTPIDLSKPMTETLQTLSSLKVGDRVNLSGSIVVARDIAHTKFKEVMDATGDVPEYLKNHIVYYAGPAKKPDGAPSGSFGPTTAARMDPYLPMFMPLGGSKITLAKGNRSPVVSQACKDNGGFYLGSIGGPAASLASNCITKVECLEYPELGMEAVWKIEVENFPAFIICDDKGNDMYAK